jgi:hypothetical protein
MTARHKKAGDVGPLRRWCGEEQWRQDPRAQVLHRECRSPACAPHRPWASPATAQDAGARVFCYEHESPATAQDLQARARALIGGRCVRGKLGATLDLGAWVELGHGQGELGSP